MLYPARVKKDNCWLEQSPGKSTVSTVPFLLGHPVYTYNKPLHSARVCFDFRLILFPLDVWHLANCMDAWDTIFSETSFLQRQSACMKTRTHSPFRQILINFKCFVSSLTPPPLLSISMPIFLYYNQRFFVFPKSRLLSQHYMNALSGIFPIVLIIETFIM